MKFVRTTGALLLAAVELSRGTPIATLFNIDQASCGPYLNTLQQWADEAASMASAARNMIAAFQGANPPHYATAFMYTMFKVMPGDDISTVLGFVQSVDDFASRGILGQYSQKPWLFCNDNAFVTKNINAQAVQNDGNPATFNNQPASIFKVYKGTLDQYAAAAQGAYPGVKLLTLPSNPPTYQYYFFSSAGDQTICTPGTAGQTFTSQPPHAPIPVVVLCPAVFAAASVALGSVAPQPDMGNGAPRQYLNNVEPSSLTLLHELFHLCPKATFDVTTLDVSTNGRNGYVLSDCITFTAGEARVNAESYAFLGLGSWYTYFRPVTVQNQGQRIIDYSAAYCQYVQGP